MRSDPLAALDAAIEHASPSERPGLVVALAARLATLGAGLLQPAVGAASDANLSVTEAAQRLGVSPRFVFKHARELGAVHVGRRVVIPERGLSRYLAGRGR